MTDNPARRDLLASAAISLFASPAARTLDGNPGALAAAQAAASTFDPGWAGGRSRSVEARLEDTVSILDFIPPFEHAAIRARTSTTDVAPYFATAVAHIKSVGGGELYIPSGRYRCGSTITLCDRLHLRGASKASAHIQFTHAGTNVPNGSGFKLVQPSNTSTAAYTKLSDLWIQMTHDSNVGACFYDNCSTYVTLRDCMFAGGRFGVIFDQTEVSGIYSCDLSGQLDRGAGLWIVNGPDITPGNAGGFTNQITVDHNCQFNQRSAHAIVDDGGDCHYFGSNNVNGGGCKFAGVANLTMMGGEFESVNGRPTMTFTYQTHYSAAPVGACSAVICNGVITQPASQPCIATYSLYNLHMTRMSMTATNVAGCVSGTNNIGTVFARQNANPNTPVPIFDTYASSVHDDGFLPIRSTASTEHILTLAETNALLQTTSGSAVAVAVPPVARSAFPVGTRIVIEQNGAGPVSLRPGAGVTINGTVTTNGRYQTLTLIQTGPNRWLATRQS